jgi:uracil-DNA glycosylase family protein
MEHSRIPCVETFGCPITGVLMTATNPPLRTLLRGAGALFWTGSFVVHRTGAIIERAAREATTLDALRADEAQCERCPLYEFATQVVPGEGRAASRLMLVGEQPGDKEDLAGRPFVGPAGRLLDEALERAGIARKDVFITNAVKHFKHEMRGKRRLHKRPNAYEIDRCKWWLERERAIVHPQAIVALGATAARSLFGRVITITKVRGQPLVLADGTAAFVTIHPSALLRIQDGAERQQQFLAFVADLRKIAKTMQRKS